MNSRSSVNESSLVNFSSDFSINALDKEPLLSFPFDHLYACHSQGSDCGQTLTLDKNVEISTHCLVQPDQTIREKDAEIFSLKCQNQKLKELLIYHLDLIQQQNDFITKKEKSLNTFQEEIDTLRERVEKQKGKALPQRHLNPPPLFHHVPTTCTVTTARHTKAEIPSIHPALFSSLQEILGPEASESTSSTYLFDTEDTKPFGHDPFDGGRPSEELPELLGLPSILDSSPLVPLQPDFKMIERLPPVKKEPEPEKPAPRQPNYTITTNSGMPIIHKAKNRKRTTGFGSMRSRAPKPEPSTIYDNEILNVNKKANILSTYGRNKVNSSSRYPYSGSLSDRLQLIDTTPTGEDPYQIGEAEMREQSPIPKLNWGKTNRVRVHTGDFENESGIDIMPTRRIYDPEPEPKPKKKRVSKVKTNRRKSNTKISTKPAASKPSIRTPTAAAVDRTVIKNDDVGWIPFSRKPKQTSLGDFSYGETSANLASSAVSSSGELVTSGPQLPSATLISSSNIDLYQSCKLEKMDITKMSYKELFESGDTGDGDDEFIDVTEPPFELEAGFGAEPQMNNQGAQSASLAEPATTVEEGALEIKRGAESKRGGRKRALSSASSTKPDKTPAKRRAVRGRGDYDDVIDMLRGYRGKRGSWIPVPPLTTRNPYHTALGHPDISWYLGHDPDVKKEDVDQLAENASSNVEVPRWREMSFTSLASAEGTENTDDEVYRKRHQKLEAEERRQLRWHMRRVREQRHVERLRLRQRDPWTVSTLSTPSTYTVWPSPLRDLQLIEITDVLPVLAFGESVPDLPDIDLMLPWVRTSKAGKRVKRSKTLH